MQVVKVTKYQSPVCQYRDL